MALGYDFIDLEQAFEPIRTQFTSEELEDLFKFIADSREVTLDEKAVADFALLAVLEGVKPVPEDGLVLSPFD